MISYLRTRLPQLLLVMLGASFLTFSLTYLSPGDPAEMYFTAHYITPTPEALAEQRSKMNLDRPFLIQYSNWLVKVCTGDLGISYATSGQVWEILKRKIPMTLRLAAVSLVMLVLVSLLLGIVSALFYNRLPDYLIRLGSFCKISIPDFWLGLLLIYLFVVKLHWFKITDPYAPASVFLPAATLAIPLIGRYTRQIRAALLEELTMDYVAGARARGIREYAIVFGHVLPNALGSLLTLFGLSTAMLMGGTVIVETIFSWPGLGRMAMDAVTQRDYPLLQAYVLFMAVLYVGTSFVVDIFIKLMDPRTHEGGAAL